MAFEKISLHAKPLLHKVLDHPFNTGLFNGTLQREQFNYFLANDALYLRHYGRLLEIISNRLENPAHKAAFLQFSEETVRAELELHKTFELEKLATPCRSIADYLMHLDESVSDANVCVAVASILPCFWLYRELGKHTAIAQTDTEHPNKLWVQTYACPQFHGATALAIQILNDVADLNHEHAMREAFLTSTLHEINFWEEAYRFTSLSLRSVRKY